MVLDHGGFEAVGTLSGDEALTLAAQSHFDLLLADVMMLPLNGVDVAIAFRQLQPPASVVLFSGSYAAVDVLRNASAAGHNFPVLAKPLHPDELYACLRGLVDGKAAD